MIYFWLHEKGMGRLALLYHLLVAIGDILCLTQRRFE
jgi:hypothetical protein